MQDFSFKLKKVLFFYFTECSLDCVRYCRSIALQIFVEKSVVAVVRNKAHLREAARHICVFIYVIVVSVSGYSAFNPSVF